MASRGDIAAGRAYVELYVRDNALTRGLQQAGVKLQQWGAGAMRAGAGLGAAASAMLAPLGAAVSHFVSVGDQLDKMSARTNASVRELSELGFAAEQSGASLENIGDALFRMSRRVANASTEMGPARRALDALGLSAGDLSQMSAGEQFEAIAEALSQVENEGLRAQYAFEIMGLSAKQLMPLIVGGSDAIRELRQEARDLGLSRSEEETKRAAALGDAMNRTKRAVQSMVFVIGDALAPVLLDVFGRINEVAAAASKWVSENRGLVIGIAAAGIALGALAIVATGAGLAISAAGIALSGIGAVIGVLTSPIGLVTAALAAGGIAWATYTESGQAAVKGVMDFFGPLLDTAKDTLGGIADALTAGDLGLAAQIGFEGLKLIALQAFSQIAELIGGVWGDTVADIGNRLLAGDVQGAWHTGLESLGATFESWGAALSRFWAETVGGMAVMLNDLDKEANNLLASMGRTVASTLKQFADALPVNDSATARYIAGVAGVAATLAEVGASTRNQQLDAESSARVAGLGQWADDSRAAADQSARIARGRVAGAPNALADQLQASREALDALRAEAAVKAEAARMATGQAAAGKAGSGAAGGGGTGTAVTFQGAALAYLGGRQDPQQELVREARKARQDRRKQIELDEKLIEELGKIVPAVFG